jgi:hypothetical protein
MGESKSSWIFFICGLHFCFLFRRSQVKILTRRQSSWAEIFLACLGKFCGGILQNRSQLLRDTFSILIVILLFDTNEPLQLKKHCYIVKE